MEIIVIGLGSMGRRRIRLLKEIPDITIYGIDSNPQRAADVARQHGVQTFESIEQALDATNPEAAFVCTSPLSHADIINQCLKHKINVFTELNLVDNRYDENMRLARENGCRLFLSSTFLYNEQTRNIIEQVKASNDKLNYIYHIGQYLPDWHPWENYSDYFIGNKLTNGCREIMAIELPWLITAFGDITDVYVTKGKNTDLNINYDDNYLIIIKHASGAKGMLAVDVVARKATRHFECYGPSLHLTWEGTPDSLFVYDIDKHENRRVIPSEANEHIEGYASFVSENPYRREINAFLDQIRDPAITPPWDFGKDQAMLKIIDRIES